MSKKRYDGRLVKTIGPLEKMIPYIMTTRTDSMNFFEEDIDCKPLDAYIKEKKDEGVRFNYIHILVAAMVRTFALRPGLNRFVMNGKIYTRPKIWVSFALHTSLREGDTETTVKLAFDGTENIFEIAEAIDGIIKRETTKTKESNNTDKMAAALMNLPSFMIMNAVKLFGWMDRHNILPKAVIELSPFHTSIFFTNLKSLGISSIYHHVYEFGTTGFFMGIGKEKNAAAVEEGEIVPAKQLNFKLVLDERYCDGLYFARSFRLFRRIIQDPRQLEEKLEAKVEDIP